MSQHLLFDRDEQFLSTRQIVFSFLPGFKSPLQLQVDETDRPFLQVFLTILLVVLGHARRLVFCTHQLIRFEAICLLQHLLFHLQRLALLLHDHRSLDVVEILPATESLLVVCLLQSGDHGLHPLLRCDVASVPAENRLVDSLLLAEVHPNHDFFETHFVLLVLLHQAHGVSVSVPSHSKEPCPQLLEDVLAALDLSVLVSVHFSPSI